jgi:hypothetical protein
MCGNRNAGRLGDLQMCGSSAGEAKVDVKAGTESVD